MDKNSEKTVVHINGTPVGWAFGRFNDGEVLISGLLIHSSHALMENNHIGFGVTERDLNSDEPREPGFYKYSGGRNTMMFLLKDNRQALAFFKEQGIEPVESESPENEWQWYVILDDGTSERCEWGYIEQALSVHELVKI